jgi:large subunit ribosomal protein L7/L12
MSVQVSEKLQSIVETVKGLSVIELADLIKALESALGVSAAAAAPVVVAAAGGAGAAAAAEEPTSFNLVLVDGGEKKIGVIKVVREVLGLGLAEAKAFVEGAPKNIKEGIEKKEADELAKKFVEAGAKVDIKAA